MVRQSDGELDPLSVISIDDMRVEESVEIDRSPEEVWRFVVDPMNDPRWCPKVKSVEASGAGRWKVMHKPVPLRPPTLLMLEHVGVDAPSRLTMREQDGTSVFNVEYRLQATGSGTRFTQASDFEWKKLPRLLHKPFARGVRRDIRRQVRELKKVLEAA